jgi:hypothetical protein
MCGAWVIANDSDKVELLVRDRLVVPTAAGAKALAAMKISAVTVDLDGTLNNVAEERDHLQGIYEALPPSRRKTLVAPRWPYLPASTNVDHPLPTEATDPLVVVALGAARYLEQLIVAWIAIEGQRTARGYLNESTSGRPPAVRELPLARR